jgi:anti-sigma regulatory factor (Ser/Thr protein kinase)
MLDALAPEVDASVLDDARLLVSELVTNSVRHSGAPRRSPVRVAAQARLGALRVVVTDAGRGFQPQPRQPGQSWASGWGLYLVDRLADRWSVQGGRSVWFEIDRRAAAQVA